MAGCDFSLGGGIMMLTVTVFFSDAEFDDDKSGTGAYGRLPTD